MNLADQVRNSVRFTLVPPMPIGVQACPNLFPGNVQKAIFHLLAILVVVSYFIHQQSLLSVMRKHRDALDAVKIPGRARVNLSTLYVT